MTNPTAALTVALNELLKDKVMVKKVNEALSLINETPNDSLRRAFLLGAQVGLSYREGERETQKGISSMAKPVNPNTHMPMGRRPPNMPMRPDDMPKHPDEMPHAVPEKDAGGGGGGKGGGGKGGGKD